MKDCTSLGLRIANGELFVLDQTRLPHEERWYAVASTEEMADTIKRLAVRGAPLIGVAAALSLAREAERGIDAATLREKALHLRAARPTAVNLMHAVDRLMPKLSDASSVVAEAEAIFDEDVQLCDRMAAEGAAFINDGDGILTHCNTGGLATVGVGTALGVIRRAHEQGKRIHVYVDETRPLLQGARLTTWELQKLGIPFTLLCDNMAAVVMREGRVQSCFVGCDRVAKNGDAANKIGTYGVAVLAHHHKIPFYVVGPRTTYDATAATGADIPIELRDLSEVLTSHAPKSAAAYNPSFDVTPHTLITRMIWGEK